MSDKQAGGKRALVTGSARGLGRAIVGHLGGAGYEVAVHYRRSREQAEEVAAAVRDGGGRAHVVSGDVTKPDEVREISREVERTLGGLDVLVNNVGEFLPAYPDEITAEQWERQLASTVSASFYVSQALLPLLRDGGGRIINISDSRADRIVASPRTLPYQVGKTGVLILTRTLARTEAPHGVTVNALLPGILADSHPPGDPGDIPAGRLGDFPDILGAVDYLLGPQADYVTGAFVQVGGGWNL